MAISKLYGNTIQVDKDNDLVDIVDHNGSTKGLKLGGTLVTATAAELNMNDNVMSTASIAYAASATTDGVEATITVKDAAGATIAAVHSLHVYISRDSTGATLTTTAASGALTAVTGEIQGVLTAKKSVILNTAATGIATLKLVDSANTAGERFCVVVPRSGKIVVGAATVGTNYEGGV